MTDYLSRLREICGAAPQEPWAWEYISPGYLLISGPHIEVVLDAEIDKGGNDCAVIGNKAAMNHIARFDPSTVSLMLAVVEAAEAIMEFQPDLPGNKCGHPAAANALRAALAALRQHCEGK